ncbi:MAG TPA: tetratricopeptide repeat protein [Pseudonocardiaceae bacterium]|nr:tetratricopeptide repeat protein [Pseudonocardiaceae bacterium]
MLTALQTARRHLGYTAAQVIDLLTRRADALNLPIATRASLKTKLSRWENGKEQPSEIYRRLFREIYGRTNAELGFPDDPEEDPEAAELRTRLAVARTVDRETVDIFRRQVDHARHVDRRFGGLTQLDQLRTQIDHVHQLLTYRAGPHRPALAGVMVEASTLAGWQALDRAALGQAWTHYERAKTAAREADSPALLAHATAEQAFVLLDLDETTAAVEQLAHARSIAHGNTTPLLRAWLVAAHGETLAAAGHADDAQRAFDTASGLLPVDPVDPALPFLFLGDSHLDRWRGHALARIGAPDAIDQLTAALTHLPADFIRARSGLLVDLAYAHAANGDRDASLTHTRQARRLAAQIKSDRQQRRLNQLVLPGSGGTTS